MSDGGPTAARFFERLADGRLRCQLCPHACYLADGQVGLCGVRRSQAGRLELPFAGAVSALAVDPIEKKPLYHFLPGTKAFSVGYLGCNLHCPFCQNYHISQEFTVQPQRLSAAELVQAAIESGCPSLAHTYSEPLIHAEFVIEAMRLARLAGLKNILVSNGYANGPVMAAVYEYCDAINIDLKSWRTDWYASELGGDLATVKASIALAVQKRIHIEVTTLVIPGKTDDPAAIEAAARWLASLDPDIPWHLSAYRPMYRYTIAPTRLASLQSLVSLACRQLRHVHGGNLASAI